MIIEKREVVSVNPQRCEIQGCKNIAKVKIKIGTFNPSHSLKADWWSCYGDSPSVFWFMYQDELPCGGCRFKGLCEPPCRYYVGYLEVCEVHVRDVEDTDRRAESETKWGIDWLALSKEMKGSKQSTLG